MCVTGLQLSIQHLANCAINRKLQVEVEPGLKHGLSDVGCMYLQHHTNSSPQVVVFQMLSRMFIKSRPRSRASEHLNGARYSGEKICRWQSGMGKLRIKWKGVLKIKVSLDFDPEESRKLFEFLSSRVTH